MADLKVNPEDFETMVLRYWLMFLRAPGRQTLPGEPVDLGEIGLVNEKNWGRFTPYSPAVKLSGVKFQNETPQIAFVNDLEEPERQPDFW
jgi:hypothetical protein